tara:strand:- start:286 stop:531 length:246 start_codon:yes stop_codon:yes gene_type:complete
MHSKYDETSLQTKTSKNMMKVINDIMQYIEHPEKYNKEDDSWHFVKQEVTMLRGRYRRARGKITTSKTRGLQNWGIDDSSD